MNRMRVEVVSLSWGYGVGHPRRLPETDGRDEQTAHLCGSEQHAVLLSIRL